MSLARNLRGLASMEKVNVTLTLENGQVLESAWPGSRLKNLNMFMLELDEYVKFEQIVKIKVEDFTISFE